MDNHTNISFCGLILVVAEGRAQEPRRRFYRLSDPIILPHLPSLCSLYGKGLTPAGCIPGGEGRLGKRRKSETLLFPFPPCLGSVFPTAPPWPRVPGDRSAWVMAPISGLPPRLWLYHLPSSPSPRPPRRCSNVLRLPIF